MFRKPLFAAFFTIIMGSAMMPASALSADSAVQKDQKEEKISAPKADNPYLAEFDKRSKQFARELGGEELKHLYHVRESVGATKAVKIVRRDVSAAVKACGEANPDLKTPMNERFASWTAAVDPVVESKEAEIKSAIDEQTYAKPKEIRDYLNLIEKTADYANKQIDKEIVTTQEACDSLMKSMDKTEKVVTGLIAELKLVPWPPKEGPENTEKKESVPD